MGLARNYYYQVYFVWTFDRCSIDFGFGTDWTSRTRDDDIRQSVFAEPGVCGVKNRNETRGRRLSVSTESFYGRSLLWAVRFRPCDRIRPDSGSGALKNAFESSYISAMQSKRLRSVIIIIVCKLYSSGHGFVETWKTSIFRPNSSTTSAVNR